MKKCECCGKNKSYVEYDEELDMVACGECSDKHAAGVEEYEELRRRRLAEQGEF